MGTYCPKCSEDIDSFLYELELRDFYNYEDFDCPKCGAKLKARLQAIFDVEEKE
jgi:DNA-directed RNA polymerase subunit RPC12/RpoP